MDDINTIDELKQGFLDLVKAELFYFGVDESKITLNERTHIEIEEHLVDLSLFCSHVTWTFKKPIRVSMTADEVYVFFRPKLK